MSQLTLSEAIRRAQVIRGCKPVDGKACGNRPGNCSCENAARITMTAARKRAVIDPSARFLKGIQK